MADEWVIIELSPRGEGEDPDLLVRAIQNTVRGAEVFVPACVSQVADEKVVRYLWEGYVFIRRQHSDSTYFKLEGTRYVQKVITKPGPGRDRNLATISSGEVDKLRSQIKVESDQGIIAGDEVKVTSGPYKGINGRVIEEIIETEEVQVFIKLRSKEAIITLPRSFLKFVSHNSEPLPITPRDDRLARWRAWFGRVRRAFMWPEDALREVEEQHATWRRLNQWVTRGSRLDSFVRAFYASIDPTAASRKHVEYERLSAWARTHAHLDEMLSLHGYDQKMVRAAEKTKDKLTWLNEAVVRLAEIRDGVAHLEKTLCALEYPNMIQNVIFDGHNLAFRAMYADKRGLKDTKGRPTGILFGVLSMLNSFRKKHPLATVYVVWDGGRDRRSTMYPEYKATREGNPGLDGPQVKALKTVLPYVGVNQLYVPTEETDDLIASLVRGPLAGQRNLIVSTDRDFLQLVTETDNVLCPRQPSKHDARTEVLFNPQEVVGQYGVEPARMVQLRALLGDESDNIPRVPRVPDTVLKALIRAHGTVEGIFSSTLSGLTTKQYETLRGFEKQARLNVKLMTLFTGLPCDVLKATPDAAEVSRQLSEFDVKDSVTAAFFDK